MASLKILTSVGKNGKNEEKDVKLVQALLNVHNRANKKSALTVDGKNSTALESAIEDFQKNVMGLTSPDGRVDANGKTFTKLKEALSKVFKAVAISKPTYGTVTWESEGAEGGRYHSRKLHVPSSVSGLTIGRGYDMKTKSAATISSDLISAGVDAKKAAVLKQAAGLFGSAASQFIIDKDLLDFQLSSDGQLKLFKISYDLEAAEVKRICGKTDVVLAYGKTDWDKLNSAIKDIAIDLKFRGDYTGSSRKVIQKSIANNNLAEFKKLLKDKSKWSNVPNDRFERRIKFLDNAK